MARISGQRAGMPTHNPADADVIENALAGLLAMPAGRG
jgi:hypothetical protein